MFSSLHYHLLGFVVLHISILLQQCDRDEGTICLRVDNVDYREKDEQVVKWQKKGKTYSISTGNSDTVAFSFFYTLDGSSNTCSF